MRLAKRLRGGAPAEASASSKRRISWHVRLVLSKKMWPVSLAHAACEREAAPHAQRKSCQLCALLCLTDKCGINGISRWMECLFCDPEKRQQPAAWHVSADGWPTSRACFLSSTTTLFRAHASFRFSSTFTPDLQVRLGHLTTKQIPLFSWQGASPPVRKG